MKDTSHIAPTNDKLDVNRLYQVTFVNLKSSDVKPFFAFIVAQTPNHAILLFNKHLGTSLEVLDVQSVDTRHRDVVILSSCPLFDNLID